MTKPTEDGEKRRDRGMGSVYQRKSDGRWVGYVTLPDDPITGKRRRRVVTAKYKNDVIKKLRAVRAEVDAKGDVPTANPTLNKWLDLWLARYVDAKLKPRTAEDYRNKMDRYVRPVMGKIRLNRLTANDVHRLHNAIIVDRKLSTTTALTTHRILSKSLTDAMREGVVDRNVAQLVEPPAVAVTKTQSLGAIQAKQVLTTHNEQLRMAVRLALALLAGMRQGECLGLRWKNVDLDAGVITVAWQLQDLAYRHGCLDTKGEATCDRRRGGNCPDRHFVYPQGEEVHQVDGKLHLLRPKSKAGWREVPIATPLSNVLKLWKDEYPANEWGLLFGYTKPRDDARAWKEALAAAGIDHKKLHSARHTTATLLYELGVPEQTRVAILGHSSATVTHGYTRVSDRETSDAITRLGDLIDAIPTPRALES